MLQSNEKIIKHKVGLLKRIRYVRVIQLTLN
jgi:hypothetical protein